MAINRSINILIASGALVGTGEAIAIAGRIHFKNVTNKQRTYEKHMESVQTAEEQAKKLKQAELINAIINDKKDKCEQLLKEFAEEFANQSPNQVMFGSDAETLILFAIKQNSMSALKALTTRVAAGVNEADSNGNTPVSVAATQLNAEAITLLAQNGAGVNLEGLDSTLRSVMDQVAGYSRDSEKSAKHIQVMQALIAAGADANKLHDEYNTPLMCAIRNSANDDLNDEALNALIGMKEVDVQNDQIRSSAMFLALSRKSASVILALLAKGFDEVKFNHIVSKITEPDQLEVLKAVDARRQKEIPVVADAQAEAVDQVSAHVPAAPAARPVAPEAHPVPAAQAHPAPNAQYIMAVAQPLAVPVANPVIVNPERLNVGALDALLSENSD